MFIPPIAVGQILTEKEIHEIFECQITFGIRISNKNNCFVIVSGSSKRKEYDDKWQGDILLYNGTNINTDSSGNQSLQKGKGNNNKQLYDVYYNSSNNKPQIFLFIKLAPNQALFKGEVTLLEPYMQERHDNPSQMVWVFPLKLNEVTNENNIENLKDAVTKASALGKDALLKAIRNIERSRISSGPRVHTTKTTTYERNQKIIAYAKIRAQGKCDFCGKEAPFIDEAGKPFLETHHIEWLSRGGKDSIENVVALCPNCHRRMHILDLPEDVQQLKHKIQEHKK